MLLLVESTALFHKSNYAVNPSHYSFYTHRLPLSFTDYVNNTGSQIYFHPLIPIPGDNRLLKYGVISVDNAVNDLQQWERFAFAGRLMKPVMALETGDKEVGKKVEDAMEENRQRATELAVFFLFKELEVHVMDVYSNICGLSYWGDVRMSTNMENPKKIHNIVMGSLHGL